VLRNYAMDYITSILPTTIAVLGPDEGGHLAGAATDLLTQPGAATISQAQDAKAVLWGGSGAEQTITSATNTFTDLMPGVDVTATAVTTGAATVSVTRSNDQIAAKFGSLLGSLSSVFSTIASKSAVTTTTASDSTTAASGGIFTGDLTVRGANDALFQALAYPVGSVSPSQLGITINQDGTFTFDASKLSAALTADPDGVSSAMQTVAGRIASAATAASDPYTGTLTASITGDQSTAQRMTDSISAWDLRLTARRSTLETTYAALETQLSAMKSQSSWLASQISGLSTGSSK